MNRFYGLSPRSADWLRAEIAKRDGIPAKPTRTATSARGVTWVRVMGPAVDGWYPGVVTIDESGTFSDLDSLVFVQAPNGEFLVEEVPYLCTRTEDLDGFPSFRAVVAGGSDVHCLVTGPAEDGWYPCEAQVDNGVGWVLLHEARCAGPNDEDLVEDVRYIAHAAGSDSFGRLYRTQARESFDCNFTLNEDGEFSLKTTGNDTTYTLAGNLSLAIEGNQLVLNYDRTTLTITENDCGLKLLANVTTDSANTTIDLPDLCNYCASYPPPDTDCNTTCSGAWANATDAETSIASFEPGEGITYYNGGEPLAAGLYRIKYYGGAFRPDGTDPEGPHYGWATNQFVRLHYGAKFTEPGPEYAAGSEPEDYVDAEAAAAEWSYAFCHQGGTIGLESSWEGEDYEPGILLPTFTLEKCVPDAGTCCERTTYEVTFADLVDTDTFQVHPFSIFNGTWTLTAVAEEDIPFYTDFNPFLNPEKVWASPAISDGESDYYITLICAAMSGGAPGIVAADEMILTVTGVLSGGLYFRLAGRANFECESTNTLTRVAPVDDFGAMGAPATIAVEIPV